MRTEEAAFYMRTGTAMYMSAMALATDLASIAPFTAPSSQHFGSPDKPLTSPLQARSLGHTHTNISIQFTHTHINTHTNIYILCSQRLRSDKLTVHTYKLSVFAGNTSASAECPELPALEARSL